MREPARQPSFDELYARIGALREGELKKLRIYAAHGVSAMWLVDPQERSVECFDTGDGLPRNTHVAEDGQTIALPPFDLPIVIADLWGAQVAK